MPAGELDAKIQHFTALTFEEFFEWHASFGNGVRRERKAAEPPGSEGFDDAEIGDAEVSHVAHNQIARAQMVEQIDADGLVLLGAVDALLKRLRTDVEIAGVMADGADNLVERSSSGGNSIKQGEEEVLRGKPFAGALNKTG